MKRSSWISRVLVLAVKHETEILDAAAIAAQEWAGKPWDPEEPELPARVRVEEGVLLRPEGLGPPRPLSDEYLGTLYREAARRYNAYPELESLARKLTEAVKVFHDGLFPYCPECELVRRARDLGLLPKED